MNEKPQVNPHTRNLETISMAQARKLKEMIGTIAIHLTIDEAMAIFAILNNATDRLLNESEE